MRQALFGFTALAALTAALFATAGAARAEEPYPWCATYNGGDRGIGSTVCGFDSLEQCRATVMGVGGFCERNPVYPAPDRKAAPPRRR